MPKVQDPVLEQAEIEAEFWAKVDKSGPVWNGTPCWLWTGAQGPTGYGTFRGRANKVYAHRFAYELLVGLIPPGLVIDHLCRHRSCVNSRHMEVTTIGANVLRGIGFAANYAKATECKHGHSFDIFNTYMRNTGSGRECRACRNFRARNRRLLSSVRYAE